MSFRENLKQELKFNGILVKELAAKAKVHKRAIDSYLLSENAPMPPADTAVRIARALGVSVEYLVTGEETVMPQDIRQIVRKMLQLNKKNRQITAAIVNAILKTQETKELPYKNAP